MYENIYFLFSSRDPYLGVQKRFTAAKKRREHRITHYRDQPVKLRHALIIAQEHNRGLERTDQSQARCQRDGFLENFILKRRKHNIQTIQDQTIP